LEQPQIYTAIKTRLVIAAALRYLPGTALLSLTPGAALFLSSCGCIIGYMRNRARNAAILPLVTALVLACSCKSAPDAGPGAHDPAGNGGDENAAENVVFVPGLKDVTGIEWKLIEVRSSAGDSVSRFSREELAETGMENAYTLRFDNERLSGTGAPNRYFAPYKEGGEKTLSVKAIAGTLIANFREPENLKEREYFNYLENAGKWDLIQNKLLLYTRNGQGEEIVLVFEAGQP
jgi:heat shock protein HslJ